MRDHSTRIVAALGATIPSAHVDETQQDELMQRVRAAADELSRHLNYSPRTASKVAGKVVALRSR